MNLKSVVGWTEVEFWNALLLPWLTTFYHKYCSYWDTGVEQENLWQPQEFIILYD